MKIKTGQTVKILSGKDKGKTGQVIQVFPRLEKVVVEGVNKSYKHLRRRSLQGSDNGQRVEFSAPIHMSNVRVVTETKKTESKKEVKKDESPTTSNKKKA